MAPLIFPGQSRAQLARAWALIGLVALFSLIVWMAWQWHRLQGPFVSDSLQATVQLPPTTAMGLFIPPRTQIPTWLMGTEPVREGSDHRKLGTLFLLDSTGQWIETPPDMSIAFPRPFGWFLPFSNSIALVPGPLGWQSKTAFIHNDAVTVPMVQRGDSLRSVVPSTALAGWREGAVDMFTGESTEHHPWYLFVSDTTQMETIVQLAKTSLRASGTRTEIKSLPDGSTMEEILRSPNDDIRQETIPSSLTKSQSIQRLFTDGQEWFVARTNVLAIAGNSLGDVEEYLSTHAWTNTVCSMRVHAFTKLDIGLALESKKVFLVQRPFGFTLCTVD